MIANNRISGEDLYLVIDSSLSGTHSLLLTSSGKYISDSFSSHGMHFKEMEATAIYFPLSTGIEKLFHHIFSDPFDKEQVEISEKITKVVLTIAGLDERFNASLLIAHFKSIPGIPYSGITIITRGIGEANHRAIFKGREGIFVRCGAGCSVFGANNQGQKHICNAWGYAGGDEGSGYSIGCNALKAVTRSADGRADNFERDFSKKLLSRIRNNFSASAFFDTYQRSKFLTGYQAMNTVTNISHHVFELATNNDKYANKILDQASDEIVEGAKTAIEKLSLKSDHLPYAYAGGVIEHHPAFAKYIYNKITKLFPNVSPINDKKVFKRVVGSALLALGYENNNTKLFNFGKKCETFLESIKNKDHLSYELKHIKY